MIDFHFHGRYCNGDIRKIFQLTQSTGYSVTSHFHRESWETKTEHSRFVVAELVHGPTYNRAPRIYTGHGYGYFSDIDPEAVAYWKRNVHYFCAPNEIFAEGVKALGYDDDHILRIGLPYSIDLLQPVDEHQRAAYLKSIGLHPERKTLFYAPSWHIAGNTSSGGFFPLWWNDGAEDKRVERLCKFCADQELNFMVRLHEAHRYPTGLLDRYIDSFKRFNVHYSYHGPNNDNLPQLVYSDIMLGDFSSMQTFFCLMNKPVVYLDVFAREHPVRKRVDRNVRTLCVPSHARPGHVVSEFDEMLEAIVESQLRPDEYLSDRQAFAHQYFPWIAAESRERVLAEFARVIRK